MNFKTSFFSFRLQYFHIHIVQYYTKFYIFEKWLKQKRNRQIHCGLSYWLPSESEKRMQERYQRTVWLPPISYTVSNICIVFTPNSIKASIMQLQTWLELLDFWSWTCKVLFERIDYKLWDYIWEFKWMAFIQHRCYYYNSKAILGNVKHTYVIEDSHVKIVFMAVLKINRVIYLCT